MITIRMPESQEEYMSACVLVERIYRERQYTRYLAQHPSTLLIAVSAEGHVLGSVGLMFANGHELPTEKYFGFDISELSPQYDRGTTFEICRLASCGDHRDAILRGLVVAICDFAERMKYQRALACMKPPLLLALQRRLGVAIHEIPRVVVPSEIEEIYAGYFLTDPRPTPIFLDRSDLNTYLPALRVTLEGKVKVELDNNGDIERRLDLTSLPSITP